MIRKIFPVTYVFDSEWHPDTVLGRILHKLPDSATDREVCEAMWKADRQYDPVKNPRPFLDVALCQLAALSFVKRVERPGETGVPTLHTACCATLAQEAKAITAFLGKANQHAKQPIAYAGWNSSNADHKLITQRAMIHGLRCADYCNRPDKPWETPPYDYWGKSQDCQVDMRVIVANYTANCAPMDQFAVACGIPGKLDTSGAEVADLWLDGKLAEICAYCETDALSQYMIWLILAHFSGLFTTEMYVAEQEAVRTMLDGKIASGMNPHLVQWQIEWDRLQEIHTRTRG